MDERWRRVVASLAAIGALVLRLVLIAASVLVASANVVVGLMVFVAGGLCWLVALRIMARWSL